MYGTVPESEITARLHRLQQRLATGGFDAALIVQNTDLYYFTGTTQQGHLYVPAAGAAILMVRKYYPRAKDESPLADVVAIKGLREVPQFISSRYGRLPATLLMELDVIPAALMFSYQKLFEQTKILDGSSVIRALRAVKSKWELERIEASGALVASALAAVPELLKTGMTELELGAGLEYHMRRSGHQGVVRMRAFNGELAYGVIVSGPSGAVRSSFDGPIAGIGLSAYAPKGPSLKPIADNAPVIVDLVGAVAGYACDVTRTFCPGTLSEEHARTLALCVDIQNELVKDFRPGVSCSDLYRRAADLARQAGFSDYFMGPLDDQAGFVAHGVGLEIDEWPILAPRFPGELQEGNVLAFEPKVIVPAGAVGIENTWVVTPDGGRALCLAPENYCA